MKKLFHFIKVAIVRLLISLLKTMRKEYVRPAVTKVRQLSQVPYALTRALAGQKPLAIRPEGKFWRVTFRTCVQHVYSVNQRRGIATMMF